ncbi:putative spermidine/putrescine transport system permease protein [Nonomuraea solani]|uniref:Putative spermidine/putrescine transport system permease protein n=1 Tax=Nonomuraea solani TaxID=1144553 RepID=A0A1H6F0D1_9ACTN|nr:ABC transporter permease [Nonomuraea solani]SEH03600.1 putative spermidine/putrescine transport system permease protein [Nonomuraea solani]
MTARLGRGVLWAFCALVGVWLVAPALIVVPLSFTSKASLKFPPDGYSFRWYEHFFSDPAWVSALLTSVEVALLVTVVATVLGTAAALGLTRARMRGLGLAQGAMLAPMIVPGVVLAVGTYAVFLKLQLVGTLAGFVMAHTVLALPFVMIPVAASLRGFDRRLESAAASLGAGRWATFRSVTLPLVAPGVASGALFAFVTSFDEVVVSLFIQSPYLQTLPVKMYASVTREIDPTIAAAATMILVLTTTLVLAATFFVARRSRAADQ